MYQNIYITHYSDQSPSQVYLWDDEKGLQVIAYSQFKYAFKRDPKGKYRSMRGEPLIKTKRFDFNDPELFESDVSRETRVLTDLYLHDDTPSKGHRVGIWDIEVNSDGGFATWENPYQEITAISFYDQSCDEYFVFILDKAQQLESKQDGNVYVFSFQTEQALLEAFLDLYSTISPTILSGWNSNGFDIPYFYNRVKLVLGEQHASRLSPVGMVSYNQNREHYQIAGVSSLDYLALYKKFTYSQKPSYRLDAIGQDEVGMGKVEYEGTLHDLYYNDLKKFIEYNLQDVRIVVALDAKMKLIELVRFICHIGHVPYEDFAYSSKFIEGTILTYLHRKGIIASNKPLGGREQFNAQLQSREDGFAGAYVKEPIPGLYEWVFSLDLQSLYPSIIMSLNVSPETKIGRVLNWNVEQHIQEKIIAYQVVYENETSTMTRNEFVNFLAAKRLNISSNGILYLTKRTGIIPEILNEWFEARKEFKNLMKKHVAEGNTELADFYDRRQHVQKILLNCFSPDTNIVTPTGIHNIRELKVGDMVYSINPETGLAEIKPVTKTYEYDYDGDMVAFKSAHIDFLTTPNHRFLMADANDDTRQYRWILSGDVMNIGTRQYLPMKRPLPGVTDITTIRLDSWYEGETIIKDGLIRDNRAHTKFQPVEYDINDWLEFLGWYISEGSFYKSTPKVFPSGNIRGECYSIYLAQEKHHEYLKGLLNRMGIRYSENRKGFKIASKIIHDILVNQCGTCSFNKKIPRWVFELNPSRLTHLYRGLMMGDGDSNGHRYSTRSKTLKDDVIELGLRLGFQAYECSSDSGMYRIQINSSRGISPCIKPENKSLVSYSGKVYCVEVADNHTLLAGRNGQYNWCGQSIYGVLGLPIFRFYDLDNAAAVTLSGQDIIKTTARFIEREYNKHCPVNKEHCIYIDTDSVYFSAQDIMDYQMAWMGQEITDPKEFTITVARDMEKRANEFYTPMAKLLFNCDKHRFYIKGESVMRTGLWVVKKRYAMKKVFDLETNKDMDKLAVKGLDVVRSSFPKAFSDFMKWTLTAILDKQPKDTIDKQILEFYYSLPKMSAMDLARRTSVKEISKYTIPNEVSLHRFVNKTPIHVKAALIYNRLLIKLGLETKHAPVKNGDKIRYVYLLPNEYGIEVVAIKTYDDPPEILELIETHIDHVALFEKELSHKLEDFYGAMKWGKIPTQINQTALEYFTF